MNDDFYPEELLEMASIRSNNSDSYYGRLLAVNPDIHRDGNPYFKYYIANTYKNDGKNKVARISFLRPEYILHGYEKHGIPTWKDPYPNMNDKTQLVDILSSPSEMFPNYIVWTVLKYMWNNEKGIKGSITEYVSGKLDEKCSSLNTKGNYVPYSLQIPDYTLL